MSEITTEFVTIDAGGLKALAEKGKSDATAVRTVRCRTVAEGGKYRYWTMCGTCRRTSWMSRRRCWG